MPTHRYPVLVVRDPAGAFTAVAVDEDDLAGFGPTAAAARDDLKDYLEWAHRRTPWMRVPDFLDPELHTFKVNVRPEYQTEKRIYPCDQSVTVRVPCVTGRQASGQRLASLPLLRLRFTYHDPAALKALAQRYALQKLEGLTPQELARHLALPHVELADVVVRIPREAAADEVVEAPMTLGRVAEPLGERAVRKQFARAWERDAEAAVLVRKLHRERASVLLVGEPGVGKTTLLVEAVREVEKRLADEARAQGTKAQPRRFWQTSAGRIIAGMKYLGQWEERVEALIAELGEIEGVLCMDRLLDLVRTGGIGPADSVASFLIPYLTRGELRLVAEATPSELDACRRLLPGLADVFHIIPVEPFDRVKALTVLDRQIETSKANLRVAVAPGVSDRVVQLYRRFMPYSVFPGQSAAFTRELIDRGSRERWPEVTPAHAVTRFMARTGLPELFLRDEITLNRESVLDWFRDQVIDQPEACDAAAGVVLTFKSGLNDPHRPLGVLLFCGPTGVGKTEMAQVLARYFFGAGGLSNKPEGKRLIRLDMSEYGGFDAVERLLGPPQGEPSELIRKVRQQPFTVVLLDEIEKASPDVFDVLLGVFDEGRLTDRFGRVTNFRSALVVMTSNLGADRQATFGFDTASRPRYRDEAMAFFRPEFFNRLDAVVTFHPLRPETIRAITRKELAAIAHREGLSRLGLTIRWSDRLVEHLATVGFDARYGARPLQRTVERAVVAPLAKWLLERPPVGPVTIEGDLDGARVVFR
ncbi:MAG TPA: AAA family ATPase [Gemmataceae bacterium]|nr:AAA family ATPase [Gemmataceae bacterium]